MSVEFVACVALSASVCVHYIQRITTDARNYAKFLSSSPDREGPTGEDLPSILSGSTSADLASRTENNGNDVKKRAHRRQRDT